MNGLWRFVRGGGRARMLGSVVLGAGTVLASVGLLAASGALISGAALEPDSLLVLLPLITSVRLFGLSRAALRYAERLVSHDLTFRLLGQVRSEVLGHLARLAPAALVGVRGGTCSHGSAPTSTSCRGSTCASSPRRWWPGWSRW